MDAPQASSNIHFLGSLKRPFGIDLYWLPIGAGGTGFVRINGEIYEAITALLQRRKRCDLYHSALVVSAPEGRYTIEQTPAGPDGAARGVVATGPIGAEWLARRLRSFNYELRRWRNGIIPDLDEAIDSPRPLTSQSADASKLLALVEEVPMLLWGRDQLNAGEMWNSNSQIAWLLARVGLDMDPIAPPRGGRAPGWRAGLVAEKMPIQWRQEASLTLELPQRQSRKLSPAMRPVSEAAEVADPGTRLRP
jgi:hypothetical protein